MQRRNRIGDCIEFIAIRLFKHMLLAAEDAATQGPVPLHQGGLRAQQMEGETIGTRRGREPKIIGINADSTAHGRRKHAGR